MHVQSEVLVSLIVLLLQIGRQVTADLQGYKTVEVAVRQPLFCYDCYEVEKNCQSLANLTAIKVTKCRDYERFCKVRRINNRKSQTVFERTCSPDCTPGCTTMLFRTQCVSCCTTDKCNSDNSVQRHHVTWHWTLVAALLVLITNVM
ncbi:uncharacterized protein [Haliotis asinina]|uniref:uncharacterized protein isoform X1 n=1 Tax=Haliotis asinina TaxID=109174 RepID=UPI003532481C